MRFPWQTFRSSARMPLYHRLEFEDAPRSPVRRYKNDRSLIVLGGLGSAVLILGVLYGHALWSNRLPRLIESPAAPPSDIQRNLSASLPKFLAASPDLASAKWAPAPISTCLPGMAPYHAPCLAQRREGAIFGEELIYPDFRLREPHFPPKRLEEDLGDWRRSLNSIVDRAIWCADEGWVCYRGQTGQNIVLANATYEGNPPADMWSDNACMGDHVTTVGLDTAPSTSPRNNLDSEFAYNDAFPVDTLLIATAPESYSFQHFLARVTHIVSQGAHLSSGHASPDVVTGRKPDPAVEEMWEMLGMEKKRIHYGAPRLAAKAIVFSCRSPLVHPWLSLRTLETFGLDPTGIPLDKRKKVVYVSGSHGGGTAHGGPLVINEDELLRDIRTFLRERGQGEELVVFDKIGISSQRELMKWFHEHVRAVIGTPGERLYNHRWTGRDTLVLELMPRAVISHAVWEEASALSQTYATVLLRSVIPDATEVEVDPSAVTDLLHAHLGKPDARGRVLERVYGWHAGELSVNEW